MGYLESVLRTRVQSTGGLQARSWVFTLVTVSKGRSIAQAALRQFTLEFHTTFSSYVEDCASISSFSNCNSYLESYPERAIQK